MAKAKGSAEVIFTRSLVGADFSFRKGQKSRIDADWAEQLAKGGCVRILSGKTRTEKAVVSPESPED